MDGVRPFEKIMVAPFGHSLEGYYVHSGGTGLGES